MIALSYRTGYAPVDTRPLSGPEPPPQAQGEWSMLTKRILLAGVAAIGLGLGAAQARAAEEVEVIHWWTSGGEAAALQVLRQNLEKEGVAWKDAAIAGGGGDQARTVLQARMAAGNPPTAMQMLGLVIQDWAEQGALGDLTPAGGEGRLGQGDPAGAAGDRQV